MEIKISIFDKEQYDGDWPPESASGFIEWFNSKLKNIPEEYRSDARIELDSVSSWEDSSYASIEIYYYRQETKEEEKSRANKESVKQTVVESRERAQLKKLQDKYVL